MLLSEGRKGEWMDDMDRRIEYAVQEARRRHVVEAGSSVVVVTGWRSGAGFTNTCRVITVPENTDQGLFTQKHA